MQQQRCSAASARAALDDPTVKYFSHLHSHNSLATCTLALPWRLLADRSYMEAASRSRRRSAPLASPAETSETTTRVRRRAHKAAQLQADDGAADLAAPAGARADEPGLASQIWHRTYRLFKWDEIPLCLRYNRFILSGYRAHLTTRQTIASFFHVHNESGNVWTHGGAFVVFTLLWLKGLLYDFPLDEQFLWLCQYLSCAVCMAMSVTYHLAQCHGECSIASYSYWLGLDLRGIVFAYVFSSVRRIWYSLYCHQHLRMVSFAALLVGLAVVLVAFSARFVMQSAVARVLAFGSLMCLVNVSTVFMVVMQSGSPTGRTLHLCAIALQVVGSGLNAARIPERFWPGRFDLFLNAHQIMHFFSLFGIMCTWEGCTYDMYHARTLGCPAPVG